MLDFKKEIACAIAKAVELNSDELYSYIEIPKDQSNGDYAFPCFKLAKELRKPPMTIADEIKEKIELNNEIIEKVDVVSGYLNFFVNKETLAKTILAEIDANSEYGKSSIGNGKNIVIDYSAPNIAKPFHIGHLRSTVIGGALYKIYKYLGYNTIGVNHLGDYGTQFGKMIEGYTMWKDEYDLVNDPIGQLMDIYVRINNLCKEDENVLEKCRNNFKRLEDGDPYCVEIWEKFKNLSLKEFQKVYDLLGSKFDSWNGEAFYSDKMPEVIDILEKTGKLVESQGAKIIDLEDKGINTPIIIKKSNDSTTYATRDLAAILYRARTYDFDKALYVTSYEQVLHFKQVFETAKLLGLDEKYTNGLEHVSFGMVLLPTGKMSTREGTVVKLEDLLNESIERAQKVIEEKNPELENKEDIAKKVGIGAVIFNDLSNNRIKDEIFDWDTILNFQGETGPYIQYTYVRTKSIIEKAGYSIDDIKSNKALNNINTKHLIDADSQNVLKLIYNFEDILKQVTDKNEPSILSRYLIDLAKAYSTFYNSNKVIVDDEEIKNARIFITYSTGNVLKIGAGLLGMEMPDKM
ncbi:MAG: arginine--tRNA ligase [Clostridia bacterium]|nr:arginine--tRNA ligase [Clostridia bacterium]